MSMVTLSILPCLTSVATLALGFSVPDMGVITGGGVGLAVCVGLIIIAQVGPGPRIGAKARVGYDDSVVHHAAPFR